MNTNLLSTFRLYVPVASVAIVLSSCTTISFKEPITSYTSAMSASSAVISDYYTQQNELSRKFYFTQLKYHKDRRVELVDEGGAPTAAYLRYSPEGIKARRDALDLISAYGNQLAILAGADYPERISASSVGIMNGYRDLSESFGKLKGQEAKYKVQYAEGSQDLVAAVTKMYAEHERDKALNTAIVEGYPAANKILVTLQSDLQTFSKMNQFRQSTQFSDLAKIYNDDILVRTAVSVKAGSKGSSQPAPTPYSESQRIEILNQVQSTAALYEGAVVNRPDDVVAAMIKANDDLYAYAKNPKSENSLVALNASLETFNARIKPFVEFYAKQREN